jgi:hypothetical protein
VNAIAPITAADIEDATWSPAERMHRAAISIHCPNQNDLDMQCRVHIAMIRDQASAGLSRCGEAAYGILLEVTRVATQAVYAPSSTKRLILTRAALTQTMDAARMVERATSRKQHDHGAG